MSIYWNSYLSLGISENMKILISNSNDRMMRKETCMKRLPVSVQLWKSLRDKWRRTFILVTTLHSLITASRASLIKVRFNNLTFGPTFCDVMLHPSERTSSPVAPQRYAAPPPRPGKLMVTTAQCPEKSVCVCLCICHMCFKMSQ